MLNKKLFILILFSLILGISCSDETNNLSPVTVDQELYVEDEGKFANTFSDSYNDYTSTYDITRYLISNSGPATIEENKFIQAVFSEMDNPKFFFETMDQQSKRFSGITMAQAMTELKKDGLLTELQGNFLIQVVDDIESDYKSGVTTEEITDNISLIFDTELLLNHFTLSETSILQYFGVTILQAHLGQVNEIAKCGPIQSVLCHVLAAAAVLATAAIVAGIAIVTGNVQIALAVVDAVCTILEALGIDFGFDIPGIIPTAVIGGLDLLGVETFGITGGQIACAIALVTGIYDAVFNLCCPDEDVCDPVSDLCCFVNCPPGTRCDNGNCITISGHCANTGCPEGYRCNPGSGDCLLIPVCNRCDPDEERCINGMCVPL